MNFSQEIPDNSYYINGYDENAIRVNEQQYDQSLIIHRQGLITEWPVSSCEQLTADHFSSILELEPEVLILGTGNSLVFPSIEIRALFLSQGIGIEVMDTGAACRTYNILLNEDRHVVAALML